MSRFLTAPLAALLFALSLPATAQVAALTGVVSDAKGQPLQAVSVHINTQERRGTTDENGRYWLYDLSPGTYLVRFSAVGFAPAEKEIDLKAHDTTRLSVVLQTDSRTLHAVTVVSRSNAAVAREQPENIAVIDTRKYYNRPEGTISLLNQTAGIKVRQSGGVGSEADVYLNGLSGKQVKFFIDGIPLQFMGAGLNLNILPINIIDRIEIYKGVVPVKLGADALGGAIDIVTRNTIKDYIDASYSFGSFNTHQATVNLRKKINPLLFASATAFFNHSDNSYKVDAEIPVAGRPVPYRARRFHDAYTNYYGNVKLGINPRKWADELSVFTALSAVNQQIQNDRFMRQAYGRVTYAERNWNNGIIYKKSNIGGRFSVNAYLAQNRVYRHYIDTSLNTYLWDGTAPAQYRRSGGGESGPLQNSETDIVNTLGRLNLHYQVNENASLTANVLASSYDQQDNNPATKPFPVKLRKKVAGLGFEQEFPSVRLTSISSVKYYDFTTQGYIISLADNTSLSAAHAEKKRWGISEALRWRIRDSLLLKASYEYATRLPDEAELFGIYAERTYPNPALLPEISHNINLGVQYSTAVAGAELNGFYRRADNIIYAPPSSSPFFIMYKNLLKGQITGLDGEVYYRIIPTLKLTVNATWQNYISKTDGVDAGAGGTNNYYNERLPNIPFLFSNGELMYGKPGVFSKRDQLSVWYNAGYTHWFYLYWAKDGAASQKLKIPEQVAQGCGVSYAFRDGYAVSFSVNNLADAKLYDNYGVQRPGRSFQVKIRTFIQ